MRLLLDTHIYAYMIDERDRLARDVASLIEDPENLIYISAESLHELITIYRAKGVLRNVFANEQDMVDYVLQDYNVAIDYPDSHVMRQLAALHINAAQDHRDPVDHLIIAQAIAHHMTLVSADSKFPFYRSQGLHLIEN